MNRRTREEASKANRRLAEFLKHPSYEVIPMRGAEGAVVEHVPKDIGLTVTASPVKGIGATMELAERLAGHGYGVAPHLSARLIEDEARLEEIIGRLREAGVRGVFVVAGDAPEPAGSFEGAAQLLQAMGEIGHGFEEVGIAGYPEGHPLISDDALTRAMREKAPYATHITSQICFDPETIAGWARRIKEGGVDLPIRIGMPGHVNRQKLVRISASIGLGESARFLSRQRNWLWKLLLPGGYSPDRLIKGLGPSFADPESNIGGFHIYTFNDVEKTERWRRGMLRGLGEPS